MFRLPRPRRRLSALVVTALVLAAPATAATAATAASAARPSAGAATASTSAHPALAVNTAPSYNGLALTPPMGFNDWAGFECDSSMNETLFVDTANEIVKLGLNKLGYDYVNIDDCWMQATRDAQGNLQVDTTRFPHGLKWLGDYIHSKGLKFGIYEDAGYETCQGAAGSYGHFAQDAKQFASWGVDYVKLDYCNQPLDQFPGKTQAQVAQIVYGEASQALLHSGRPMVFSESAPAYVCCSGANFDNELSWISTTGNLWRFGSDIYDAWPSILTNFDQDNTPGLAALAGPGHWNDADMFEIGNGGLTLTEEQTQFTLWSEMASPLLLSTDLAKLSPAELAIVGNKDVIAVDQDPLGAQGTIVQSGSGYDVLAKPLEGGDVSVVLFNRGNTARTITTTASAVGLPTGAPYQLENLVSKQKTVSDGVISANLAPHATVIYRVHTNGGRSLPPSTVAGIQGGPFTAGKAAPVKVTLTDNGYTAARQGTVSLSLPKGWTATPATADLRTVAPGRHASVTFEVTSTAPPPGIVTDTVSATVGYRAGTRTESTAADLSVVTDTPFPSLSAAFNNVAVTDESDPGPGNFDGDGDSYDAQALATAGVTPGATITSNGATFTWPTAAAGTEDNVEGDGVLVDLSGSGSKLAFLGSEAGFDSAAVTVTYTDGTTSTGTLGFPNWCCAPTNAYGATPAVVTTNRDTPTGPADYGTDYDVFYNAIAIDAGKTVATVTLPDDPAIHIFAMTVQQ
jgi:alpha-galactosidase